jgi:hypothetical protein
MLTPDGVDSGAMPAPTIGADPLKKFYFLAIKQSHITDGRKNKNNESD